MRIFTRIVSPLVIASMLMAAAPAWSQNYPMGSQALITTCGGFFTDSGGNNNPYSANENLTMTICPQGNQGTHVQLVFSNADIREGDQLCFFDGNSTAAPPLSCSEEFMGAASFIVQATAANPTGCLTMTFTSDANGQGQGWSAAINCIQACQNILVELVSSDPLVMPLDTGWIDACQGQRVYFSGRGIYPQDGAVYNHSDFTSEFVWDFGDGNMAVGPEVSHIYPRSGGYRVQLTITDQRGCKNINFLSNRVRIAPEPKFQIGEALPERICLGDTVSLTAAIDTIDPTRVLSADGALVSFQTSAVLSTPIPLPDGTGVSYETSVTFSDFSPGQTLTNINDLLGICVNMEHSWMHDLEIRLRCPNGNQVILQNQQFITQEVFLGIPYELDDGSPIFPPVPGIGFDYCWTPTSTNGTWTQFVAANSPGGNYTLPSGNYNSFQPLTNLLGCPLNGEWTLIATDFWASDNGWIFEWSVNLNPDIYPNLETFKPRLVDHEWRPSPHIFSYSADSLDILSAPQSAGTASYTFTVIDEFGCAFDTSLTVRVLPTTHPDCYDCLEIIEPLADATLCAGESLLLDVSSSASLESEVAFEAIPLEPFGFANYPPSNPLRSTIAVNSIHPAALTDAASQIVGVCLNVETNWNSDLSFFLRAPSGQLLELSSNNGGGSQNYLNTCFTPTATVPITAGMGPFTGEFRPEGDWSTLNGSPINGEWTLIASDAFAPNDVGKFISWSITFRSANEVNYTWTGAGLSCTNCPAPIATPSSSSTYQVTATDSYGCMESEEVFVEVVSDIPGPVVLCGEDADGNLLFSWDAVGSFVEYEYNLIINGLPSGWVGPLSQFSFQPSSSNLQYQDEVELQVRAYIPPGSQACETGIGSASCRFTSCVIQASLFGAPVNVGCSGGNDGAASVQVQGNDGMVQYFLNGNLTPQANGIFTGLVAGNYELIVIDAVGCSDTLLFAIAEPPALTVDVQVVQLIDCHGNTTGSIQASPQGGNGGYLYAWTNAPGAAELASGLGAGTYGVTVTDSRGCTASNSIVLAEPEPLTLNLNPTAASCAGLADGAIQAFATGGNGVLAYSWSDGGSGPARSDLLPAQYCVTVEDANGCQISDCIELSAPVSIVVDSITVVDVACHGGSNGRATVHVSGGAGGFAFVWNDPLAQISAAATMLPANTYSVQVTDANGCQIDVPVAVGQPEALAIAFQTEATACFGGSDGRAQAAVSGGIAPYNYNWQNGQTAAQAINLAAGAYQLTVTDSNGCTAESATVVGQPDKAVEAQVTQTFRGCFGAKANEAMVTASGGTGNAYTYLWSNGATTPTASGLDSIVYAVTVTDVNGCAAVAAITPHDLPEIDFFIITTPPSCHGYNDGRLGINEISGGVGGSIQNYQIVWSSGATGPTANNLLGGQQYSVTVTDSQGCSRVKTRNLQQPALITFQLALDSVSCFGLADGAAAVVNVQGSQPPFLYAWSNGQQTSTVSGLAAGTYSLTVTDPASCFNTTTFTIPQPTALNVAFEKANNSCFGETQGRLTALPSGGSPGYTFAWSSGQSSATLDNLPNGEYTLTLTDRKGCVREAAASIQSPEQLLAAFKKEDPTCFGFRNGSITVETAGGVPPYRYSLDNQAFMGSNMLIALRSGNYQVYVRDANGCLISERVEINDPPQFSVDAGGPSFTIELGDSVLLQAMAQNAAGMVEFVWEEPYPGTLSCTECQETVAKPQTSILYRLYGIDSNGCEATDRVHVYVQKNRVVEVPTGFTPNDDGINDLLLVHGRPGTMVKQFRVFNRWGEMLYEAADFEVNDQTVGWDGTFRGKPADAGVYIWYLVVEYEDAMEDGFRGQTTLIR
jgi:gliding motility-associated-like protein